MSGRDLPARELVARALARAFWQTLERNPMPPMAALEAAAGAVGDLYRQVAALHGDRPVCGCGWRPDAEEDLVRLEAALAGAPAEGALPDLAALPAAGTA
ncbi:conserved hypothetical protein [Methylobacterium sp. 4-46]|uniref:hypothetical protein n=1 Tax=unclassified Methylobacterium TaxID=2615210 RepID=UPI000165CD87|nr:MULTISPECIES: hypothetical protein [Methylobacterium]ACA18857.1 conserved hypothetical protein [Methylobacterium sp. 4-46]WFT78082.1 hypothetical protein QA634_22660 [Methylobacterium nodulans]